MKQSNIVKIFKALSNEQRLELFMMIYNNRTKEVQIDEPKGHISCCSGMEKAFTMACNCFKISRSTISHHIKELQNAGLISCQRIGQSFYCEVNNDAIEAVQNFLK